MKEDGFIYLIQKNAWGLIVAAILISMNWGITTQKLNGFDKELAKIELRLSDIEADVLDLQISYASDISEIKVSVTNIDKSLKEFSEWKNLQIKNIRDFYEKYGSTLNPDGN